MALPAAVGAGGADAETRIARVLDGRRRLPRRRLALAGASFGALVAAVVGCAGPEAEDPSPALPELLAVESPVPQPIVGRDEIVQAKVEEELLKLEADDAPLAASVVVVEVETGRVLALAGAGPKGEEAALEPIEAASVLKPLAAAAALEAGLARDHRFETGPVVEVEGHPFRDHDPAASVDVEGLLVRSSNAGAARLAEAVGPAALQDLFTRLGLASPHDARWGPLRAALSAAGIGLKASPAQLARAYAVLGNDGVDPVRGEAVVSPENARAVREMLEAAVEHGTGRAALVEDLRVAGKTGTMEAVGPDGAPLTRTSFAGFVPADAPRWVIHVRVDTRKSGATGGSVAAPLFRKLAIALNRDC